MGRTVQIIVGADISGAQKGFKSLSRSATGFGNSVQLAGQRVDTGLKSFRSFATSGAGLAGGVAFAAGVSALKKTVDAAANAQQVLGQTKVALDDAGLSWDRYGAAIEGAATSLSKLGFDDEEALKAISTFARATGDVDQALRNTSLAADIARARYIDLATASAIVLKASLGQAGALRRIGIDAKSGATGVELLTLLSRKYGGAASAAADDATTSTDRLKVSLGNVQEQIGSGLLPTVTTFADGLSQAADQAARLVGQLQKIKVPGTGKDGGPNKGLASTISTAFGNALILGPKTVNAALDSMFGGDKAKGKATNAGNAFGQAFGLAALEAAGKATASKPAIAFGQPGFKPGKAPAVPPGPSVEQRNTMFDNSVSRATFRADGLQPGKQLEALKKVAAILTQRIAVTKDVTRKLNLEDQLIAVGRQSKGLRDQIGQEFADRIASQKRAKQAAAAARVAAISARQFRELGLGSDGNAVTPGVSNLKKRLGNFAEATKGTFLDTDKMKAQLARFRKVLSEGLVPKDVRAKVAAMLDDLNQQLRDHDPQGAKGAGAGAKGPLTKTSGLDTKKVTRGLGLTTAQASEIRGRLSSFNSAGVAIAGSTSTGSSKGKFVGGRPPIVVESHVTVQLDGNTVGKSVTRSQQKAKKRNPAQRRGPNRAGGV